jgi:hypothetical protein
VSPALPLDEMFSGHIADQLRSKGHNVLAVVADPALLALPDDQILAHATATGRPRRPAPSPPCSPSTTRSSPPSSPASAARRGRKPAHWTRIDRDYETLRISMQRLFDDLGITPTAAAAA